MIALSLADISKRFGPTVALDQVSFAVAAGEVHALLGENGAGKSTLMHVANGMLRPDRGTIVAKSEPARSAFRSPRDARDAGIGMVHQHFTSIPAMTVAENIALFAGWRESGRAAERRAQQVVARVGLPLPVTMYAAELSVQLRQRLEIVKALATDATTLLLDEPTAVLAPPEVDELFAFIRAFAANGGAVVLITHKLAEVFRVADRVTVLRRGQVTFSGALDGQSAETLTHAMIGADVPRNDRIAVSRGVARVVARELCLRSFPRARNSFTLYAGEVVGIAAIDGNGQRELLRTLAEVNDAPYAGALDVAGPTGFIPEDRVAEGIIGAFTLTENFLLGQVPEYRWWLDWPSIRQITAALLVEHDVRASGADLRAAALSGGNQQKFILGRVLQGKPHVLVAEDPTRGLDLLATEAVHAKLRHSARNGAVVVFHSSDLDEVILRSDRIFVMVRGEMCEMSSDVSRQTVGRAMLSLGAPS